MTNYLSKAIKVGELIEKLKEVDSEKRVYLADWNESYAPDFPLNWDDTGEDGYRIILGAG
jgi:hypothetical protein